MNRAYQLRAAWHFLHAFGEVPSRRNIQNVIRQRFGKAPRTDIVSAYLTAYQRRDHNGYIFLLEETGPVAVQDESVSGPVTAVKTPLDNGIKCESGPERVQNGSSRADQESKDVILTKNVIDQTPSAPIRKRKEQVNDEPVSLVPKPIPRIDDTSQPEWVLQMRQLVQACGAKPLCDLSSEERFRLAMYHAWRWGNCRKDELANRRQASRVAAGITNLACHRDFSTLTPGDYIATAQRVWEQRGMTPWYRPWDITGQIDPPEKLRKGAQYAG